DQQQGGGHVGTLPVGVEHAERPAAKAAGRDTHGRNALGQGFTLERNLSSELRSLSPSSGLPSLASSSSPRWSTGGLSSQPTALNASSELPIWDSSPSASHPVAKADFG